MRPSTPLSVPCGPRAAGGSRTVADGGRSLRRQWPWLPPSPAPHSPRTHAWRGAFDGPRSPSPEKHGVDGWPSTPSAGAGASLPKSPSRGREVHLWARQSPRGERRDESRGVAATHRGDERRRVMRGVSGGVRPSAVLGPGAVGRAGRPEPMATAVRQFWQNGRSTTTKQRTHTRKTGYLHKEKSEICPARSPAARSVPCEPRAPPPSRTSCGAKRP